MTPSCAFITPLPKSPPVEPPSLATGSGIGLILKSKLVGFNPPPEIVSFATPPPPVTLAIYLPAPLGVKVALVAETRKSLLDTPAATTERGFSTPV